MAFAPDPAADIGQPRIHKTVSYASLDCHIHGLGVVACTMRDISERHFVLGAAALKPMWNHPAVLPHNHPTSTPESLLKSNMKRLNSYRFGRLSGLLASAGLWITCLSARADVAFLGVAAGDATSTDAVLWTRAVDPNTPGVVSLTVAVAPNDPTVSTGVLMFSGTTDPNKDYVAKVDATGLQPGTRYYYRFSSGPSSSIVGTFKTAPDASTAASVRFAFSGDVDGLMRPYALTQARSKLGVVLIWHSDKPRGQPHVSRRTR